MEHQGIRTNLYCHYILTNLTSRYLSQLILSLMTLVSRGRLTLTAPLGCSRRWNSRNNQHPRVRPNHTLPGKQINYRALICQRIPETFSLTYFEIKFCWQLMLPNIYYQIDLIHNTKNTHLAEYQVRWFSWFPSKSPWNPCCWYRSQLWSKWSWCCLCSCKSCWAWSIRTTSEKYL